MISAYKKQLLLVLSLILVVSLLAACGKDNTGTGESTNAGASTGNEYKEKYDPPVTLTTVWGVAPEVKYKNGETIENNVATKWAKEQFGIEIKSLWSVTDTNNALATKLRLAMSSGQDMPDVLVVGNNDPQLVADLVDSGYFGEAGDLFDKYANDTWKKAMELDPNVWNPYIRDGKKMGIPVLDYAYNNDYLLWIRQDWLDKLNMKVPTTIAELETVMEAFKNNNPDGLAPDKVTPLSIGFKTKLSSWMGDPSWIFGAYGAMPEQWNVGTDGNLEYGSINTGMKQGLEKLSEWSKKGFIPKEAALWDENKTAEPAVAGTAGIIPGPYWMSGWPLADTAKNVPTAKWTPIALPKGPDGKATSHGTPFSSAVILINKDIKHPEALFTYENWMFDNFANPAKGSSLEVGMFKGYDYDVDANGNTLYQDDIPGGYINIVRYFLVRDGARIPDAQMTALLALADGKEPETKLEKDIANSFGKQTPEAAKVLMSQKDVALMNMFTGPTTPTMKSKMDYLKKIELQTFNEIIYGTKPIDAFDTFVANWKKSGGEQITKEVNEWYASVK
ncbi:sugar ABC transporter [Paenibacillus sp. FSL H8-0537]|uniref:sugar ABC transporter n=1 Tax=Paenibacillus sp. FSL H8-0537 TaxID=2921399 RepID=UPI0031018F69